MIINHETALKTLRRMTHEILEKNDDLNDVVLIGILKKGLPVAQAIRDNIRQYAGVEVPVIELDISMHRDDDKRRPATMPDFAVAGKVCILVDDVLFTGRTARAAMDAIVDMGRPKRIEYAVLVDRGHRELPIRADYVGKNAPTSLDETVIVNLTGPDAGVYIERTR
ncbi:MAG: bifunctional pyr operon transcriptional regulator/uracil phosphoribosyltransferase PyrR [Candidatus Izemoplasmatales bacterium]